MFPFGNECVSSSHLLALLLDEEHEPEVEEGVGVLSCALTGELLGVRYIVAGLLLDHVQPGWLVHPRHQGEQDQQWERRHSWLSGEDICMRERESKSGEPDSERTWHDNHAEHHASSEAVRDSSNSCDEEKHN